MRAGIFAIFALYTTLASGESVNEREHLSRPADDSDYQVVYRMLGGNSAIICYSEPSLGCGLEILNDIGEPAPLEVESLHWDCTDEKFVCISNLVDVFAMPRDGLRVDSNYKVFGAKVRVERCYYQKGSYCHVALLSSVCLASRCSKILGEKRERIAYFFYESERGVTAFFSTSKRLSLKEPAIHLNFLRTMYVLTQGQGFLKANFNLSRRQVD